MSLIDIIITEAIWSKLPPSLKSSLGQHLGRKQAIIGRKASDIASRLREREEDDLAVSLYESLSAERIPESSIPAADHPKGRWETLREVWVQVILAVILAGAAVTLFVKWQEEWRAHDDTKGQLARERKDREDGTTKRDDLQKTVTELRTRVTELERLHPILKFYGTRAKVVASFELNKEAGEELRIGNCPKAPCFRFTMLGIRNTPENIDLAEMTVSGIWEGIDIGSNSVIFDLPLKPGCRSTFAVSLYEVTFVIEAVQYKTIRAGIGISLGPSVQSGIRTDELRVCPEELGTR
jgi:hypothetical protein